MSTQRLSCPVTSNSARHRPRLLYRRCSMNFHSPISCFSVVSITGEWIEPTLDALLRNRQFLCTLLLAATAASAVGAEPNQVFDGKWLARWSESVGDIGSATLELRAGKGRWESHYFPKTRHRCLSYADANVELRGDVFYLVMQPSPGPPTCMPDKISIDLAPVGPNSLRGRWPSGNVIMFERD